MKCEVKIIGKGSKKVKIYSTRHGQTDFNKKDLILGVTDIPLNETGKAQAEELAELLKDRKIDVIVSSPMKRALDTAKKVSEKNGAEIVTDSRLREWDYGSYEGKTRFAEGFAEGKREFAVRMGGTGESPFQVAYRVYSLIDEVREKYGDKTVLLVSHGGICRVIETYFHDMTVEQYSNWFMGNCQLIEYEIN